ncbi:MAG: ABC transporter permease [Bryobacterales bacterium]|nr:ABC transporter permease [Bryobacterales bacterium]
MARQLHIMVPVLGDLTVALRGLRRSPAFALLAVSTLSLGIGANATIFSIVNSVLLRPLTGFETDRLLRIQDATHQAGLGFVDPEAFKRIRTGARAFEQLAGMQFCQFALTGASEPEQVWGPCVTANWFDMQRAPAMLGRTFLPGEDLPGRNRVVVLDHGFWLRRFGGERDIVGRRILLDGQPWVVIGVMPAGFRPVGANASAVYTPYVIDENAAGLYVTGRLQKNVTSEQAQAELRILGAQLHSVLPRFKDLSLTATPVLEDITGPATPLLHLLMGAVSLVLLISCVNVANLFLARSAARQREMDIRVALGASTWRIVRFLVLEALVLCTAAGIAAVAVAYLGVRVAAPLISTLPRADEVSVDLRVFGVCLAIGVLGAIALGTLPVVRSKHRGLAATSTREARRWPGSLIAAEVAISFVLLVAAGLLLRTFSAMRQSSLGYDARNVLTHFLSLPPSPDGSRTAGLALIGRLRDKIAGIPGVTSVATSSTLPMGGVTMTMDVQPEGQAAIRGPRQASLVVVSDRYFQTAAIPLVKGRAFGEGDREGTAPVAIVSQSVANRHFNGSAVGKRLVLPRIGYNLTGGDEIRAEIVGVAGNICVNSVSDCQVEHLYLPESQSGIRMTYFLVRSKNDPMALAASVKRVATQESPLSPLDQPQTLEQRTAYLTDSTRQGMWLAGAFAALAVLLAASGVYGVSNYLAGLRRKEIGIRVALGATFSNIVSLIYGQALIMAAGGLCLGVIVAAGLSRFLEAMLFKVRPHDPTTIAVAVLGTATLVILASTPAALRSAKTDAASELRRE